MLVDEKSTSGLCRECCRRISLRQSGFERVKAWLESPPQNRQEGQVFAGARVVLFKLPPFRYFFEREVFAVGRKPAVRA